MPSRRLPLSRRKVASISSACWCRRDGRDAGRPDRRTGSGCPRHPVVSPQSPEAFRPRDLQAEGRSLIYAAEYPTMNGLLSYLTENCCQGDPTGCGVGVCDGSTLVNAKQRNVQ